jgi:type I restriction enzyme, S subunit
MAFHEGLPKGWRLARFDEFLRRIERKVVLDDTTSYKCVGVRWYGMGAFVREQLLGIDITRKQQWIIKSGDIVYNKLFAWKGAFAIADESVEGCIVSDKFPTYEVNLDVIDPLFLECYFRTPKLAQQAQVLSKGAAAISKLTLNSPQFWDLTIPLPPLSEQRRIVARIEELAAKIEEAHGLRQQASQEAEALVSRVTDALLDQTRWPEFPLNDLLCENSQNGLAPRPSDQPPGTPILRISAVTSRSDAIVDEGDFKYLELNPQDILKYSLNPGDLLACRFNGNLHYVGRFALYRGYSGRSHVYPDKLIRFRVNQEKVLPEFVCLTLNCSKGRTAIESFCATTAGNIGISAANLRTVRFAVPSLSEQHSIVAYLDDLQAKVDALKRLQVETASRHGSGLGLLLTGRFQLHQPSLTTPRYYSRI